jgi:hypothetical protein
MKTVNPKFVQWLQLAMIGIQQALSGSDGPQISDYLTELLSDLFTCISCESPLVIERLAVPRFFMGEVLTCPTCEQEQQFPLNWLITATGLSVEVKGTVDAPPAG